MRCESRRCAFRLLGAALLLLVGCNGPQAASTSVGGAGQSQSGASIQAIPNPVPAGRDAGTTTITWTTGDGSDSQVYVTQDGGAEKLFAGGPGGSAEAPWIQTGSTYDFSVYAGLDHKTKLASVRVTRGT